MLSKGQFYPNKNCYSIKDLEAKLKFSFFPQIAFETSNEKKAIKTKGIHNEITMETLQLGKKFNNEILSAIFLKFLYA